ncbi:DUF6017 domain-containing protein [Anaerovorax sp. IOR16]|uniref:DUF6017 domain-containing protein n=1 Tax=Anaerovorax sp. IOR16 TaxID=2773458 RepID=UPI0019D0CC51|nr:DUF6017 domain-containing protein [Anaerovorax sp. IOR16]
MAVFRVMKNQNYTVMSNYHLKDKKLSLKAKGLLSLMLSLPEDWDYTLKGLAAISKDGIDSINAAIKELSSHGYILRQRVRNEKGQLEGSEYTIFEHPQLIEENSRKVSFTNSGSYKLENPKLEIPILDNPTLEEPKLENPILGFPNQGKPKQENPVQLNTNIQNKDLLNTNQSIDPSMNSMDEMVDEIKEKIEYEILKESYDQTLLSEIVELMAEVKKSNREQWMLSGNQISSEDMKRRIQMINSSHIQYVLNCLSQNTTKVYNMKNYLLAALYNAPATMEHYYQVKASGLM